MRLTPRVAGFRSEYPAGFKLECMAGFVGTRNTYGNPIRNGYPAPRTVPTLFIPMNGLGRKQGPEKDLRHTYAGKPEM